MLPFAFDFPAVLMEFSYLTEVTRLHVLSVRTVRRTKSYCYFLANIITNLLLPPGREATCCGNWLNWVRMRKYTSAYKHYSWHPLYLCAKVRVKFMLWYYLTFHMIKVCSLDVVAKHLSVELIVGTCSPGIGLRDFSFCATARWFSCTLRLTQQPLWVPLRCILSNLSIHCHLFTTPDPSLLCPAGMTSTPPHLPPQI